MINLNECHLMRTSEAVRQKLLTVCKGVETQKTCPYCGATVERMAMYIADSSSPWAALTTEYDDCGCPRSAEARAEWERERKQAEIDREAEERNKRIALRRDKAVKASQMPERWKNHSFDNYDFERPSGETRKSAVRCRQYAIWIANQLRKHDLSYSPNGLFLTGDRGTGKTHLAAAVLNYVMDECPTVPVLALTMQDMAARLKSTYDSTQGVNEEDVINTYIEIPLLLIDDLGSEQATEWTVDRIFRIINGRYNRNLPTIITTNYDLDALAKRITPKRAGDNCIDGEKITDRISEMCVSCPFKGDSYRLQKPQRPARPTE